MICSFCGNVIENVPLYRRFAEYENRTFINCPDCSAPLTISELRAAVRNYSEQRGNGQNYIKDDKGRFAGSRPGSGSGSASGAVGSFIGSGENTPAGGDLKNFAKAIANYGKSAIMDTGEHEMYPDSIAGVKRGKPMTFDEADNGRANPHYSSIFVKIDDSYSKNCQSSVVAHEARMRGYDVQAKAYDPSNVLMNNLAHFSTKAWIDPKTGKEPKMTEYKGKSNKCGNWLDSTVKQGERYSVEYTHKGGKHILTVSRGENGVIRLYDPQSNQKALGIDAINAKFGNAESRIRNISILRVDNLDFNISYANAVLKK